MHSICGFVISMIFCLFALQILNGPAGGVVMAVGSSRHSRSRSMESRSSTEDYFDALEQLQDSSQESLNSDETNDNSNEEHQKPHHAQFHRMVSKARAREEQLDQQDLGINDDDILFSENDDSRWIPQTVTFVSPDSPLPERKEPLLSSAGLPVDFDINDFEIDAEFDETKGTEFSSYADLETGPSTSKSVAGDTSKQTAKSRWDLLKTAVAFKSKVAGLVNLEPPPIISGIDNLKRPGFTMRLGPRVFSESNSLFFDLITHDKHWKSIMDKSVPKEIPVIIEGRYYFDTLMIRNLRLASFKKPKDQSTRLQGEGIVFEFDKAAFELELDFVFQKDGVDSTYARGHMKSGCTDMSFHALLVPYFEEQLFTNGNATKRDRHADPIRKHQERELRLQVQDPVIQFNSKLTTSFSGMRFGSHYFANAMTGLIESSEYLTKNKWLRTLIARKLIDALTIYFPSLASSYANYIVGDVFSLLDEYLKSQYDIDLNLSRNFYFSDQSMHCSKEAFVITTDIGFKNQLPYDRSEYVSELKRWFYGPIPKKWKTEKDPHKRVRLLDDPHYEPYRRPSERFRDGVVNVFKCVGDFCKKVGQKIGGVFSSKKSKESKKRKTKPVAETQEATVKKEGWWKRFGAKWNQFWRKIFRKGRNDNETRSEYSTSGSESDDERVTLIGSFTERPDRM